MSAGDTRPLIAHILFRFDYGGMENGIVNIVNGLSGSEFRHAIIALTEATDFRRRIRHSDVEVFELRKRPGKDPGAYVRLLQLLRKLRPSVVHTRNIGTLDCAPVAWLAGVPVRIHGEHGWDVHDPDGTSRKYSTMRRTLGVLVHQFVTVSQDLERWLTERVGIAPQKVQRICNGVDTERFQPGRNTPAVLPADRFPAGCVTIGTVTRFNEIKDPLNLVRAFIEARSRVPNVRLVMAGDGPLRQQALALLESAGVADSAWLPGSRDDVSSLMRELDVFVLGSLREGISNTVLEAMASGLPVIASATGGNLELVVSGQTGRLVAPGNSGELAGALVAYASDTELRKRHGQASRERAVQEYSLARMLSDYRNLYRLQCREIGVAA